MADTINKKQYSILAFFIMSSVFLGPSIQVILKLANQDSWISIIIGYIFSFIPLYIYYKLFNINSNIGIVSLINKKCKTGKLINTILIIFIIFHSSIMLWNLTNFINSQYLYQTPLIAISILFIICIIYLVNNGLNNLGKSSIIISMISIFLIFCAIASLASHIEIDNLKPFFEYSPMGILKASIANISYNVLPLFALLIIPKNNITGNKKITKNFIISYSLIYFILFIVIFYITTILGAKLSNLYQYPEYHILKSINVADFFQRIESIISLLWVFNNIFAIAFYIYYIKKAMIETYNFKDRKIVTIMISILVLIISHIVFKNNTIAELFFFKYYPTILIIFLFIIPTILLIIFKLKK